jgi:rubrerythrin
MSKYDLTRSAFLTRSALAAAGIYGVTGVGRALAHEKHGAFSGGDIGIVNFALTLEKIEVDFYNQALETPGLSADAKKLFESIAANEDEHVKSLTQSITQLGGKADPAPETTIGPFDGEEAVIRFAIDLEDTGVSAYNGAATQIRSADVLQAVASIAQVEARHAGALRELAGDFPTVSPFDKVFSGEQADAAVHELTT